MLNSIELASQTTRAALCHQNAALDPTCPVAAPLFRLQRARSGAGKAAHTRHVHLPPLPPPSAPHAHATHPHYNSPLIPSRTHCCSYWKFHHLWRSHIQTLVSMVACLTFFKSKTIATPGHVSSVLVSGLVHVTRHTSHVTRHTSHVTRHTSHVTRHRALPHATPFLSKLKTTC